MLRNILAATALSLGLVAVPVVAHAAPPASGCPSQGIVGTDYTGNTLERLNCANGGYYLLHRSATTGAVNYWERFDRNGVLRDIGSGLNLPKGL